MALFGEKATFWPMGCPLVSNNSKARWNRHLATTQGCARDRFA